VGDSRPVITDRASCTLKRHLDNARPVGSVYPIEKLTCIIARCLPMDGEHPGA
jgi:hypothetical protein